jgi:hypothetical protein
MGGRSQRLPKQGDVLRQVSLFHRDIVPDLPQQEVFVQNPARVQQKVVKEIERLGRKMNLIATPR